MQRAAITSCLPPLDLLLARTTGAATAQPYLTGKPLANLATGHFIRRTKGSITALPW